VKIFIKIKNSIYTKLILVLTITAVLANLLVGSFFKFIIISKTRIAFEKNLHNYINYIIRDIGDPPNISKAKKIAKEFFINIRYESPDYNWSSSDKIPAIKYIKRHRRGIHENIGLYKGMHFIVIEKGNSRFLFINDTNRHFTDYHRFIYVLIVLLTTLFVGAYFSIRWLMKPVKSLTEGVDHVTKGDFDHQIPVIRNDELGALAKSFNFMTKRIREMIQSRDQLLLDVSHELRSPLTRMNVALEFVKNRKAKDVLREDISEMGTMVKEILETERLRTIYGKLQLKKTDLVELLKDVSLKYLKKSPGLNFFPLPGKLYLYLDQDRIRTVIKNILENSFKYSASEKKPIEISITEKDSYAVVEIKDYGSGIPEEELPFIFEPFFRADRSRSKDTGGYGLGMSLCKKIIEAHNGAIEIKSRVNYGTTVILKFSKKPAS